MRVLDSKPMQVATSEVARDINKSDVETALNKTVTAEASRARDGSRAGLLRTMTLPDGKLLSACPQNC